MLVENRIAENAELSLYTLVQNGNATLNAKYSTIFVSCNRFKLVIRFIKDFDNDDDDDIDDIV